MKIRRWTWVLLLPAVWSSLSFLSCGRLDAAPPVTTKSPTVAKSTAAAAPAKTTDGGYTNKLRGATPVDPLDAQDPLLGQPTLGTSSGTSSRRRVETPTPIPSAVETTSSTSTADPATVTPATTTSEKPGPNADAGPLFSAPPAAATTATTKNETKSTEPKATTSPTDSGDAEDTTEAEPRKLSEIDAGPEFGLLKPVTTDKKTGDKAATDGTAVPSTTSDAKDSPVKTSDVPHNKLREESAKTEQPLRAGQTKPIAPVEPNPATTAPVKTAVAPPTTTPSTTAAKPTTTAPTTSTATETKSTPSSNSVSTSSSSPSTAVVGDRRLNSLLNGNDDEGQGKKAAVSNRPAEAESQKLFESTEQPPALTPEQEALRRRVQTTLANYYQNWTLNTREHTPWEVMHAIIAYGVDTRLNNNGRTTTAMGHLLFSGTSGGQAIVTLKNGRPYMQRGVGVQGHAGQFLAILAQSHLQRDYPLYVGGKQFTLEDLVQAEQYDCESGTELTFKLIGLMHYLPSDATWKNFQGQTWSIDRLVREEIVQPIRGAACGGTHRLMGLSYAIRKREQRGEPITGIYAEAAKYIDNYHKYTFGLQNPDGSFSTAWFVRREGRIDLDRRLQTTGHVLEWLCFSLSDEQIRDPRVAKSVRYVTNLLLDESGHEWEIGHLGHALHALQLYNERVYAGPMRSYERMVTRKPSTQASPLR
jgi:hypothetical protein